MWLYFRPRLFGTALSADRQFNREEITKRAQSPNIPWHKTFIFTLSTTLSLHPFILTACNLKILYRMLQIVKVKWHHKNNFMWFICSIASSLERLRNKWRPVSRSVYLPWMPSNSVPLAPGPTSLFQILDLYGVPRVPQIPLGWLVPLNRVFPACNSNNYSWWF